MTYKGFIGGRPAEGIESVHDGEQVSIDTQRFIGGRPAEGIESRGTGAGGCLARVGFIGGRPAEGIESDAAWPDYFQRFGASLADDPQRVLKGSVAHAISVNRIRFIGGRPAEGIERNEPDNQHQFS